MASRPGPSSLDDLIRRVSSYTMVYNTGPGLMKKYGGVYVGRPQAEIKKYVLHHSASSRDLRGEDVWRYHVRSRGWNTPGYNILINGTTGEVEILLPPSAMSYGAGPQNNWSSLHVCVTGHYAREEPLPHVLQTVYTVLCALDDTVGYNPWRGHREVSRTACPGDNLQKHLVLMRSAQYGAYATRPTFYP